MWSPCKKKGAGRHGVPRRRAAGLPSPLRLEWLEPRLLLADGLMISEFMAANDSTLADQDGDFCDWIEIHNPTDAEVDLTGWYLTDSADSLRRWQLPAVTLDAGAYLIVFASDKDRADPAGQLHANFKLGSGGEYLALVRSDGITVQHEYAPHFPAQYADASYGVGENGQRLYFFAPTPGEPNGEGFLGLAEAVQFSEPSGTFDTSFLLELTADAPEAEVRYTLDGSLPMASSHLYAGPITVAATTRIRARVFEPGMHPGPVVSHTYLKLADDVQQFDSNLPIVVIDTFAHQIPPTESADYGEVYSVFIDTDGTGRAAIVDAADFTGRAGIRIRGRSSTQWPKKQYKFETWNEADEDRSVSILGLPAESDWVLQAPYSDKTLMRNYLAYKWFEDVGHYSIRTRFVEMFLSTGGEVSQSDYVGVYVFMETVKRDDDRVDVTKLEPGDNGEPEITGGYILAEDNSDRSFTTNIANSYITYMDPVPTQITTQQQAWIRNYINDFEAALYSPTFTHPVTGKHYSEYIDVDSHVDYDIFRELTRNFDGGSTFMSLERGGKLTMGPLWDYNMALGNSNYGEGFKTSGENRYYMHGQLGWCKWWDRMDEDPDYLQRWSQRWVELREDILSTDRLMADVDEAAALLGAEAAARNFQRWPLLGTYVWANPNGWAGRNTFQSEVDWMKQWLTDRLAWLDGQVLTAPEFSYPGGDVDGPFEVTVTALRGTVYYTTDDVDPRLPDGAIYAGATALSSGSSVTLYRSAHVMARAFDGAKWSPLGEAEFFVDGTPIAPNLLVTELDYHPQGPTPAELAIDPRFESDDFEFLELYNATDEVIDLTGTRFGDGIELEFTARVEGSPVLITEAGTENIDYVEIQNISPAEADTSGWVVAVNNADVGINAVHLTLWNFPPSLAAEQVLYRSDKRGDNYWGENIFWRTTGNGWVMIVDEVGNVADFVVWGYGTSEVEALDVTVNGFQVTSGGAWTGVAVVANDASSKTLQRRGDSDHGDAADFAFTDPQSKGVKNPLLRVPFATAPVELGPQETAVVVSNLRAFEARYGTEVNVIGQYAADLDDDGERIALVDRADRVIVGFRYDDADDWPAAADGLGLSLQLADSLAVPLAAPQRTDYLQVAANWTALPPTPGAAEATVPAEVVGRYVFYNNSAFDRSGDDQAVAPDKEALLPGQTATAANYTSYVRGINGVMMDIDGLSDGALLGADDFRFRVGNDDDPDNWPAAPAPQSVSVHADAGLGGRVRVAIVWEDHAIRNHWLQVTVAANGNTLLAEPDVFYFGNAVAEAGNSTLNAIVDATDEACARNFQHGPTNLAAIDDPYDYNRDRLVNTTDRAIARNYQTGPTTALRLIADTLQRKG